LDQCVKQGDKFDPAVAEKIFHICGSDSTIANTFPSMLNELRELAPKVQLQFYQVEREQAQRNLANGSLDFALDATPLMSPDLQHERIFTDRYVCAVRKDHPEVGATLTLEQYLTLDHMHVSSRPKGLGHVDMALQALGKERHISLRSQHYISAPMTVARSDLALSIPYSVARLYDLKILELPFDVETLDLYLYWHKSADHDQANQWMRELIINHARLR